jgi:hypothetical protein
MQPNFYSVNTGEQFYLSYKSKVVDGTVKYYELGHGWKELLDGNGDPLRKIEPTEIHPTGIRTDTASRF